MSDKNFKVKNGIDANGTISISSTSNSSSNLVLTEKISTRTNLVLNPAFVISDATGWGSYFTSTNTIQTDNTAPYSTKVLQVQIPKTGNPNGVIWQTTDVLSANTPYSVSLYIKGPSGVQVASFSARPSNVDGSYLGEGGSNAPFTFDGTWQKIYLTSTPTVNYRPGFQIYIEDAQHAGVLNFYIHGVVVESGSTTNLPYFDGSQNAYASKYRATTTWAGTANASKSTVTYISQTSNAFEVNGNSSTIAKIDSYGNLTANGINANGASTISSSSLSDTTFSVSNISGQYGLIQAWNVDGSTVVQVDENGHFYTINGRGVFVNSGWIGSTRFAVTPWQDSSIGMIIKGQPSQTGDLTQWQNSDGTVLAKIDSSGSITAADLTLSGNLTVNGTTTNLNSTNLIIEDKNIIIADVTTPTDTTADGAGITIKGATDKTFNWVQSTGSFASSEPLIINTNSTTKANLIIKSIASQTSNLQEWQNQFGSVVAKIDSNAIFNSLNAGSGADSYSSIVVGGRWIRNEQRSSLTKFGVNTGEWHMASNPDNSVIAITDNQVGIFAIAATLPTFTIKGVASQSAVLQDWQNSTGVSLANIDPSGYFRGPLVEARPTNPGLYGVAIAANASQSGDLFQITDASNNAYTGVSSTGKFVTGNTTNNSRFTQLTSAALGQLTVYAPTSSTVGIVIKSAASQTANLTEWQTSAGAIIASLGPLGDIWVNGSVFTNNAYFGGAASYYNATINIRPQQTSYKGIVIQGRASQTGNLQEWQNSSANILAQVDAYGSASFGGNNTLGSSLGIGVGGNASQKGITVRGTASQTANLQEWQDSAGTIYAFINPFGQLSIGLSPTIYGNSRISINTVAATAVGQVIRGVVSQTANLQEWQNSAGTAMFSVQSDGSLKFSDSLSGPGVIYWGGVNIGGFGGGAGLGNTWNFTPYNSSRIAVIVRGASSQTADLQQWQGSSGTVLASIIANGNLRGFAGLYGTNSAGTANYPLFVTNSVASTTVAVIKGAASQSANLQEWQNSAGTVLAKVDSSGSITAADLTLSGNLTVNGTTTNLNSTNLVIEDKNIILADVVTPTDTTADGAGITIKGATDKTFNWVNSTKSFTSSEPLIINNTSTTTVPLTINGYASQTSNLFEIKDSSSNVLFKITPPAGDFAYNNRIIIRPGGGGGPAHIGSDSFTFRVVTTGGNVIGFGTHGGGTSFDIIASDTFNRYRIIGAGTGVAPTFTTEGNDTDVNMYITAKGAGKIGINKTSPTGYVHVLSPSSSTVGMIIQAAASQSADLQQWQNSAGTNLAIVDATGNISDASNTKWLSPIGSGSDDAPTIQALIDAGKKEIRLGSGQWTFSTRIKVPNGVILKGIGSSTTSTTGTRVNAVALIASEGTVRDITFTGAGENSQNEVGGGIAVLGGRVIDCSVSNSRIVLAPTRQPHGYLKNFMSKMQSGYGSVKVAVLGDSLSENTSTTSWYGYLFNSTTTATGYYLGSYFSHQIAPSEVDNMAIGGQGAYLLSAQLAMTKETLRTGDYVNQVLDGDRVSTSPFFNRDYNLAILAIGQNGGEDWKAHLEYTVKTIRDKGIDVIILTQNPAASNPTSRAGDEYFYRSMAETYGCLLVDTQAYFRLEVEFGRALGTTADLFGDSVHQSALGHQLYAKAILNALLDYDSTAAVPANKTVVSRSYIPAQADRAAAIAGLNSYYLVKRPDSLRGISGVTYTTATDTSIRNPIYGRGTTTNSVATIASGGYATWGVEYATAAYVIYRENATANTLTVALQAGGSTLATLTTGVTNGRTSVQKVMLSGGYPANRAIRITNTSGDPVQIYGVMFETHADVAFNRNTDGSYAGVKLNGSWTYSDFLSMASYGGYLTPHTSTTNDSVTFKFYGDGLRFATSYGKNSGIIQVKIDDTTYTAVDTYNNIGEYGVYTHFYGGLEYGLHTATITLTGANASVTGDLGHGARFGLHRISAVRSEWYLTQDQQFAPNSDTSSIVNSVSSIRMGSVGGANIATFYNGTNGYGAGSITSVGTFNINGANMGFPYTSTGATLNVNAGAASIVPLTVRGVASQTANLQEWQNSAGTVLTRIASDGSIYRGATTIDSYGAIYTTETMAIGANAGQRFASGGMTIINRESASAVIFGVKGISSQTGDLTQWRNSSDNILAKIDANGNFSAITKSFDIPHPTKENMRLRYSSLEGPENGVYVRGTLESNIIELPEYWTGLVHEDSITVSLTAVGSAQNIYVEKIENNKVYIGGELIKAFFTVYGERKDIDKLTVEY